MLGTSNLADVTKAMGSQLDPTAEQGEPMGSEVRVLPNTVKIMYAC